MHPPAEIAGLRIDAIATTKYPETPTLPILDPIIVENRPDLAVACPPFTMDAFGAIAAATSCILPRQPKRRGGWSGGRVTTRTRVTYAGLGRLERQLGAFCVPKATFRFVPTAEIQTAPRPDRFRAGLEARKCEEIRV